MAASKRLTGGYASLLLRNEFGYQSLFLKISLEKQDHLIIRVVLYSRSIRYNQNWKFQDLTPEASHSATAEQGLPIMFCAFVDIKLSYLVKWSEKRKLLYPCSYLSPNKRPDSLPSDAKVTAVRLTTPLSFLGEISTRYIIWVLHPKPAGHEIMLISHVKTWRALFLTQNMAYLPCSRVGSLPQ